MDGEGKIGRILEQKRQEKGLSLDEVEQATKIRTRYLDGPGARGLRRAPRRGLRPGLPEDLRELPRSRRRGALAGSSRSRRKPRRERGIDYNSRPSSDFERPLITPGGVGGNGEAEDLRLGHRYPARRRCSCWPPSSAPSTTSGRGVQVTRAQETTAAGHREKPARQEASKKMAADRRAPEADRREDRRGEAERPSHGGGRARQPAERAARHAAGHGQRRRAALLADCPVRRGRGLRGGRPARFSQTFEADRQLTIKSGDAGAVRSRSTARTLGVLGEAGRAEAHPRAATVTAPRLTAEPLPTPAGANALGRRDPLQYNHAAGNADYATVVGAHAFWRMHWIRARP